MTFLEALVLGFVQGITEFLPISSSGHLVVAQHLMGLKEPEIFFDVILHLGTFLAVLLFFKKEISEAFRETVDLVNNFMGPTPSRITLDMVLDSTAFKVLVGTIPVAIVGFTLRHQIEAFFLSPFLVGINFWITAFFLGLTYFAPLYPRKHFPAVTWKHALFIGIIQCIALAPGVSRSGSTICAALITGCEREKAATFSFFLFIPAVVGAVVLESLRINLYQMPVTVLIGGFISSFLSGSLALKILMFTLKKGSFYGFAFYCFVAGIVAIMIA